MAEYPICNKCPKCGEVLAVRHTPKKGTFGCFTALFANIAANGSSLQFVAKALHGAGNDRKLLLCR